LPAVLRHSGRGWRQIAEITADPDKLSDVLVKWMAHDDAKPSIMQNENDKSDIAMMLMVDAFFQTGPKQWQERLRMAGLLLVAGDAAGE
jgi:hypothetical protein